MESRLSVPGDGGRSSHWILHMADRIDTLVDAIFHIAEPAMESTRPKRLIVISFVAITVFAVLGTLTAIALGPNLAPFGNFVLNPFCSRPHPLPATAF